MSLTTHHDLFSYRELSVLPESTQKAVYSLGQSIKKNSVTTEQISIFRDSLKNIPASAVPRASAEIREIAQICQRYPQHAFFPLVKKQNLVDAKIKSLLETYSDLGWILIFHGSGFIRQAALESLNSAPQSEFEYSAIVYRLNDWVENVRFSAVSFAKVFFPKTFPAVIGESIFYLLPQSQLLTRWSIDEQSILDSCIYRPDVLEYLKEQFSIIRPGRIGYTLQQVLRHPGFDIHLEYLAGNAALPSVRALSMDALLHGRTRWFVGYKKQWIAKVYGVSRRIAEIQTRSINVSVNFQTLLLNAASDKSALVRKVAADSIIANRDSIALCYLDGIAQQLSADKNASVRSRIEFYFEKTSSA